jgi:hypothetical protein
MLEMVWNRKKRLELIRNGWKWSEKLSEVIGQVQSASEMMEKGFRPFGEPENQVEVKPE